jgi:hypothetical protein
MNFLKSFLTPLATALAMAWCATGWSQAASAASILVEVEFTLGLIAGTDTPGIDGADVYFTASFDADGVYASDCCAPEPQINAVSHKFVISGASFAASNGTFIDPVGAAFFPNNDINDGFESTDGFYLDLGDVGGSVLLTFGGAIPDQVNGTPIDTAHFDFPLTGLVWLTNDGSYEAIDPVTTVTLRGDEVPVPAPASGLLLLGGLAGLGGLQGYMRRRKAA